MSGASFERADRHRRRRRCRRRHRCRRHRSRRFRQSKRECGGVKIHDERRRSPQKKLCTGRHTLSSALAARCGGGDRGGGGAKSSDRKLDEATVE